MTEIKDSYKISVLIVTYNNAVTIADCIGSLLRQSFKDFEIVVRDNGSDDASLDLIKKHEGIAIYSADKNEGFAAGMNYLAAKAKGEFLFMLNPDCICPEHTLERLYTFARANPGAISPALMYPDGRAQLSARRFPNYRNVLFSRRSPLYQLGLARSADAGYVRPLRPAKVPAVSATALFMAKKLFDDVGGFDESFFLYLEDIDFCARLAREKIDIWYLPDIKIVHKLGASSSRSPLRSLYYHHRSMLRYFTKYFPDGYIKNCLLMILLVCGFLASSVMYVLGIRRRR